MEPRPDTNPAESAVTWSLGRGLQDVSLFPSQRADEGAEVLPIPLASEHRLSPIRTGRHPAAPVSGHLEQVM
jgi:hypothetical protein